jgi:hypothetical protein
MSSTKGSPESYIVSSLHIGEENGDANAIMALNKRLIETDGQSSVKLE